MNIDNKSNAAQSVQAQTQTQTPNHVEHSDVSSEEMKKEKIRANTEKANQQHAKADIHETNAGKSFSVMHFSPHVSGDIPPDPAFIEQLLANGQFSVTQGVQMNLVELLVFLSHYEVSFSELFFFTPFIENEEVRSKVMKLIQIADELMKSGGDASVSEILLKIEKGASDVVVDADGASQSVRTTPTPEETLPGLFKKLDENITNPFAPPKPEGAVPSFTINIFDSASRFALLLMEISKVLRQSSLEVKESLSISRQAVNKAAIDGIITKGQQELAFGISGAAAQAFMGVGGGAMSLKSATKAGHQMKLGGAEIPAAKHKLHDAKGFLEAANKSNDTNAISTAHKRVGEAKAELLMKEKDHDYEMHRAERSGKYGEIMSNSSHAMSMFFNSIGSQQGAVTEAQVQFANQIAQTLAELFDTARENSQSAKGEEEAAIQLLKQLIDMDAQIFSSVRL